jgi:hypothetical protein
MREIRRDALSGKETLAIQWRTHTDVLRQGRAERARLDDELYLAPPTRESHQYPKRRHYSGETWFSNTARHVWHESLFERRALLWLDFTYDIVEMASQPMRMNFANGNHHYPDLLAMHSDGRQVVYDVRPLELIDAKAQRQFDDTDVLCKAVGWGYEIISEFDASTKWNMAWLSNFRQNHFAPPAEATAQLFTALASPCPLQEAADAMQVGTPRARKGWLYHLAWLGDVLFDLTIPLSDSTFVRKAY